MEIPVTDQRGVSSTRGVGKLPTKEKLKEKLKDFLEDMQEAIGYGKVCLALIFLALIIIIMAFAWPYYPGYLLGKKCVTPKCLRVSASLVENMDQSLNACEKPFDWACGKWIKNNRVKEYFPADKMQERNVQNYVDIPRALEMENHKFDSISWKLQTLFRSCMNHDALANLKPHPFYHPVKRLIDDFGGWKSIGYNQMSEKKSFVDKLKDAHLKYDTSPFFRFSVAEAYGVPNVQLKLPTLGMPINYYINISHTHEIVTSYKNILIDISKFIGNNAMDSYQLAENIYGYESRIAHIIPSIPAIYPTVAIPDATSIEELKLIAPSVPLFEILQEMSSGNITSKKTRVLVPTLQFMKDISGIISTTDENTLNDYLLFSILRRFLPLISPGFRSIAKVNENFKLAFNKSPKWVFCSEVLYELVPLGIGYVMQNYRNTEDSSFSVRSTAAKEVFQHLKAAILSDFVYSKQLEDTVQQELAHHLAILTLSVGLEGSFDDEKYLENHFKDFYVINNNYFENIINLLYFKSHKTLFLINEKLEYYERASAYAAIENVLVYERSKSVIAIPHYFIDPSYFDADFPKPVNYGRLGVVMGEGIAFSMSQYDFGITYMKYLSMKYIFNSNKWSMNMQCFRTLTNAILRNESLDYILINATLQNNIHHLLGVKIAAMGLDHYYTTNKVPEVYTPGLEMYGERGVFLLSYIQDLCTMWPANSNKVYVKIFYKYIPQLMLNFYPISMEYFDEAWCTPNFQLDPSC